MRRYLATLVLVIIILIVWGLLSDRKADANLQYQLASQVMGQSPAQGWSPIIRLPKVLEAMIAGQIDLYRLFRNWAAADLAWAQALPVGRTVNILDPNGVEGIITLTRDEYIAKVTAEIATMDAHIADLGG